jgi:hypothetical protein
MRGSCKPSLASSTRPTYRTNQGPRISGTYERAIITPSAKLALIRRDDTCTLAPWEAALEPMRGQAVTAVISLNRVSWSLDRRRQFAGQSVGT